MVERRADHRDLDAICQALAHPTRRALIDQLAAGAKRVGGLAEPHDMSLAAVSEHLHVLEDAGLIEIEKDARVRRCPPNAAPLSAALGWLTRYRIFWEDRFGGFADHLEDQTDEG